MEPERARRLASKVEKIDTRKTDMFTRVSVRFLLLASFLFMMPTYSQECEMPNPSINCTDISLTDCRRTDIDATMKSIKNQCPNVGNLDLSWNRFTSFPSEDVLRDWPILYLNLAYNNITMLEGKTFLNGSQIRHLDLSNNNMVKFGNIIPDKHLKDLRMLNNPVCDEVARKYQTAITITCSPGARNSSPTGAANSPSGTSNYPSGSATSVPTKTTTTDVPTSGGGIPLWLIGFLVILLVATVFGVFLYHYKKKMYPFSKCPRSHVSDQVSQAA